jgi:hypothetical protein
MDRMIVLSTIHNKGAVNMNIFCGVLGAKDHFHISLEDEVVRGSIVVQNGQLLWPPPPPPTPAAGATPVATPKPAAEKPVPSEPNYFANTLKDAAVYTGGNKLFVFYLTCSYQGNYFCGLLVPFRYSVRHVICWVLRCLLPPFSW